MWDTHKEIFDEEGNKHKRLSVPGRVLVVAIILSSIVGAIGVYIEETERREADEREQLAAFITRRQAAVQISRLSQVANAAERAASRFSGTLLLTVYVRDADPSARKNLWRAWDIACARENSAKSPRMRPLQHDEQPVFITDATKAELNAALGQGYVSFTVKAASKEQQERRLAGEAHELRWVFPPCVVGPQNRLLVANGSAQITGSTAVFSLYDFSWAELGLRIQSKPYGLPITTLKPFSAHLEDGSMHMLLGYASLSRSGMGQPYSGSIQPARAPALNRP